MAIFLTFFLGNIGQENILTDILERKNHFLSYKNKKFKKSKNGHFSKRVNPRFWSKNVNDILEPKNAFLGFKNNKFK